ncbi:MAG TPA: hypothetical protein VM100_03325 [Longimicrobiales bacterium]|nr:hypothetical protein [Longimicrobiales bacterium]
MRFFDGTTVMTGRRFVLLFFAILAACSGGESSGPKGTQGGTPANITVVGGTALGSTAAGFEMADSVAVRVTDNLNAPIAGQAVTFSIVAGGGSVSAATKSTGPDGIARTSWTVGNSGAQTLRATAGSLNVDITANAVSCSEISLAVGQVQSLSPDNTVCAILNGKAQRYLVTIVNAANFPLASAAYKARGVSGAASLQNVELAIKSSLASSQLSGVAGRVMIETDASARVHDLILKKNNEVLQRFGPQAHSALHANQAVVQSAKPSVGDLIPMKVPDITGNSCASFTPLVARVVYVGSKGIVLEDNANVLKGQVDTLLIRVGHEFDDVIFPILNANFGNPIAMDAQLNNDGALYMLISDKVNNTGATGFVSNTDFLPTAQCPSSNAAEVFYARGLTPPGTSTGELDFSFASTSRRLASTIMHESKHLTSAAAKLSQPGFAFPAPSENAWLEESSAEIAMELLSRVTYKVSAKSNLDYATTLAKEARPASGLPLNMFHPFTYFYTYSAEPETRSLVGSASAGDLTFYGSGWAFLRWVIDTYATNESAFLTAMTHDVSHWGVANIENLTGKSFPQLLSEFSLAIALDDYPGFTPEDAKYSFPSWNLRSIFAGMHSDFGNLFPLGEPLPVHSVPFGKFSVDVGALRGGGLSVLEVAGTQVNKQLLEIRGPNGASLSPLVRVNIARVQ